MTDSTIEHDQHYYDYPFNKDEDGGVDFLHLQQQIHYLLLLVLAQSSYRTGCDPAK